MAKNFIAYGNVLDVPPNIITEAVTAGQIWALNDVVGILLHDGAANAANQLQIEGVFQGAKKTGASSGGTQGKKAYVIADGGVLKFTADATGAQAAGIHYVASGDNDTTAQVKLAGVAAVA